MRSPRLIAVTLIAALTVTGIAGCSATTGATPGVSPGASAVLPVNSNPISNTSTAPGLSITYAAAENNIDQSTRQPIGDRLEFTISNATSQPVSGLEVYYTMTDATTKQSESYYQALTGLTIPAGSATTVYFDNHSGPGHYPENTFSLYRSSTNEVDFTIEVSAPGLAPATATAVKGPGTGEVSD